MYVFSNVKVWILVGRNIHILVSEKYGNQKEKKRKEKMLHNDLKIIKIKFNQKNLDMYNNWNCTKLQTNCLYVFISMEWWLVALHRMIRILSLYFPYRSSYLCFIRDSENLWSSEFVLFIQCRDFMICSLVYMKIIRWRWKNIADFGGQGSYYQTKNPPPVFYWGGLSPAHRHPLTLL